MRTPMCLWFAKFWPRPPSPFFSWSSGPILGGAPSSTFYPGIIQRSGLSGKEQAPGRVLLAGVSFGIGPNNKNFQPCNPGCISLYHLITSIPCNFNKIVSIKVFQNFYAKSLFVVHFITLLSRWVLHPPPPMSKCEWFGMYGRKSKKL